MNLNSIELNDAFNLNPSASEFIPKTPPQFLPSRLTPGAQARSSLTPLDSIWKESSNSPSPQSSKKLIKFGQNVHFPKDFLNKCLKMLPPDVSLVDVKYQPDNFQEKWFDYLEQRKSEKCKTATEEKASSIRNHFVEDMYFIESEKTRKFSSVSKSGFVSSMTQIELDSSINKKFGDLSYFNSDFKEEFTALSIKEDSQSLQLQHVESDSSLYHLYP